MRKTVCVMTSAHPAFDVRIFQKECKSLAEAGYQVILIAPHKESIVLDGVQLIAVPKRESRFARATLGVLDVLISAIKVHADLYHFHDPELIPAGLFLRLLGRKVIYDIHEDLPETVSYKEYIPRMLRGPLRVLLSALEKIACHGFSALVTVTPFLAARFRASNSHIAIVRNYPLLEEFSLCRPGENREKSLVYVGMRITAARGAVEIVKAIDLLPPENSARLVLIGAFDPPQLQKTLETLPGWQKTEARGLLGRKDIAEILSRALAGLVTIHPEENYKNALPVKLFEYMAAGIPVIASDFPEYRKIVEEAHCGLLVNPLEPQEIATAMNRLIGNPHEALEMGENGRAAVLKKYNWQKEREGLLALYEELLSPAVRPASLPTRQEL